MRKQCPVCEKRYIGSGVRAYNGKGSFEKVCSVECAKEFESLSQDSFNQELEYYKELNEELSKLLSMDTDDNIINLNILKTKQEIEILESIYGYSQKMLV